MVAASVTLTRRQAGPGAAAESAEAPRTDAGFEAALSELRPDLYRYAFWLTRDSSLAEDAVQEALIRGWRSRHKLRDGEAIKPWFLTIIRRECARMFARKRLETRDLESLTGPEQALIATAPDEMIDDLRAAIFALDASYREPLVLQVLMGFSADEIADVIGINRGAVLTRLCRARKMLARRLNDESLGAEG